MKQGKCIKNLNEQQQCRLCQGGCKSCECGNCLQCSSDCTAQRAGDYYNCQCPPPTPPEPKCYYNKDQTGQTYDCDQCNSHCKECSAKDECITCINNLPHRSKENNPKNCKCNDGYFQKKDINNDLRCIKCHYKCKMCSNFNTCINKCNDINRNLNNNCECYQGYYDDNERICQKCPYPCKKCQNQFNCTYNQDSFIMRNQCIDCNNNQYFDCHLKICIPCKIQCQTCNRNSNKCLSCHEDIINNQDIYFRYSQIKNNCRCLEGFYQKENELQCQQCKFPCKTCYSVTQCKKNSCTNNKNRDENCYCKKGFFENGEYCQKCNKLCKNCEYEEDNCI